VSERIRASKCRARVCHVGQSGHANNHHHHHHRHRQHHHHVVGLLLMLVVGKPLLSVVGLLLLVAMTPLTHVSSQQSPPSQPHTWLL
jgi:hypothetical protein